MNKVLLEIKEFALSVRTNGEDISILKDVNIRMEKGESLALLGKSGSGKSMLALNILGLMPDYLDYAQKGHIILNAADGTVVDLCPGAQVNWKNVRGRKISMIFQDPLTSFNPVQTCGTQISEVLTTHFNMKRSTARRKSLDMLENLGLDQAEVLFSSYPHQMSGGQLQRMMIAMAIVGEPELLIADEATSNLDQQSKSEVIQLIKKIRSERELALLYITHNLTEAESLADKFCFLAEGKSELTNDLQAYKSLLMPDLPQKFNVSAYPAQSASSHVKNMPLIALSGVSRYFTRKNFWGKESTRLMVLNNIDLDIFEGETIGLYGASGSGKSTLGRIILHLDALDSGKVLFENTDIAQLSVKHLKKIRKSLQIVYQNPYNTLNPRMSALDIVREPLEVHKIYKSKAEMNAKAAELLILCGVQTEKHTHYMHQFSGGQRQRIAIARAMVLEPKFVVLDECVSSLDTETQEAVLKLLADLKKRLNLSYLFISHDMELVEQIADRIFELRDGQLYQVTQ